MSVYPGTPGPAPPLSAGSINTVRVPGIDMSARKLMGKKAAMLCTASVEEVIDQHYKNQINQLKNDEKELKNKIVKFRNDELQHKDIAYEEGATKEGFYSIMDKIIKTGSKIAIGISEKI